MAYSVV